MCVFVESIMWHMNKNPVTVHGSANFQVQPRAVSRKQLRPGELNSARARNHDGTAPVPVSEQEKGFELPLIGALDGTRHEDVAGKWADGKVC